ncbi:MAG: Dyp-type peroxidase [Alphaproteobacteria bacterium]|jgi:putative iron-dependent peroxidase|nr:Dyp-type peroxidase [Alphaproteobacteria bacterium]
MAAPQPGIFIEGNRHHTFLEYATDAPSGDIKAAVAESLKEVGTTHTVVAFGPDLWARLAPGAAPDGLAPFAPIEGLDGKSAPSTQRDLLYWIQGAGADHVFDRMLAVHNAMQPVGDLELEQPGFVYHDSRDLTGFIDGTANPKDEARLEAALVPDGEAGAGGALVLSQRWVHDLDAFNALPVAEQERVIGRTKADSIELEGDAMPADSHVSRTDLKVDGVAMKIWRRSVPFGSAAEVGLYFLAFACERLRFDVQLESMFGATGDGIRDRLTDFSRPVTGSYWFAPSAAELAAL